MGAVVGMGRIEDVLHEGSIRAGKYPEMDLEKLASARKAVWHGAGHPASESSWTWGKVSGSKLHKF